jgi:CubicO group peptidase (beta-lactamase class C family)
MNMRRSKRFLAAFAAAILFSIPASSALGQCGAIPSAQAIDEYFTAFAAANRIPGLSVAVVADGRILFSRGYGSDGLGGPMTSESRLCVGSVSKTFTSLAVLQLAESGAIDLDAPFKRYVPAFAVDGPGAELITVRQLLSHTSGLAETGDPRPEIPDASLEDEVLSLAQVKPFAAPGTKYRYYNKNYRALGYLVERMSGLSYGEYLRRKVFEPLGMTGASTESAGIARGTAPFFGFALPVPNTYCPGDAPAGGLVMGASAAAKYLLSLLSADPGFLAKMGTVPSGVESRYGLGWTVEREGRRLTHGGDVSGFHAYAEIDLDSKVGCIVLCRQNGLWPMLSSYDELPIAVHALLAGEAAPDPRSSAWLQPAFWAFALLAALYQAWRFFRLPAWLRKAERRAVFARVLMLLPGILAAVAALCLPLAFSSLMGLACGWADLFHFIPDLAFLVLASSAAALVRACLRILLLIRRGAAAREARGARGLVTGR